MEKMELLIIDRYKAYSAPGGYMEHDISCVNSEDSLSHFLMCIMANHSVHLRPMICSGEMNIFMDRLSQISPENISVTFKKLLEALNLLLKAQAGKMKRLNTIIHLIDTMLARVNHIFKAGHKETCCKSRVVLPFTFPLRLVSQRKVELTKGKVKIPCGQWKMLLESVFEYLLDIEMNQILHNNAVKRALCESEDDKLRQLVQRCRTVVSGLQHCNADSVQSYKDIDNEVHHFPPCMANLHSILRQQHRLSFDSRYQFTLFLKDIGLPVEENLLFWEEEYRKPHEGSHCQHFWEDKKSRYTYQVLHLYGLTGSCVSKTSHSCDKFIDMVNSKMNGGCPFQHSSMARLMSCIPDAFQSLPMTKDIFYWMKAGQPRRACAAYLRCQAAAIGKPLAATSLVSEVSSPLQFYNVSKSIAHT